jgi:hypothetical protein
MSFSSLLLVEDIFDRKLDVNKYSQIFINDLKLILAKNYNETFLNSSLIGNIEYEHIRPLIWETYLNKEEIDNIKSIKEYFQKRKEKYKQFETKIKTVKGIKNFSGDPLGNNQNSEWKTFFEETEVKKTLNLDIIRTYPNKSLFKNKYILNILTNTLVMWSLDNSKLSYRQGMNEICAVIIICLYPYYHIENKYEFIDDNKLNELLDNPEKNYKELYNYCYNDKTFEFDIYELFYLFMKNGVKKLYETVESKEQDKNFDFDNYKKYELFQFKVENYNENERKNNKLIQRCDDIIKQKLKNIDSELFNHFVVIDLNCSLFLQKWLKCLFNREFKINEIVLLWDCIVLIGNDLEFIDFITVSILISLRDELLIKNQDDCFQTIFTFNQNNTTNILKFIGHAYKLMDTYHNKIFKKNVNQTIENKPSFLSNLLNNSNPNTTNNNNKSNNSRIFSSESSSFKTPSSNIFSNPYQNTQNKNNEFKKEIENKNQNNNNKNESNLSKTKNYISNAMSSFGSFIKGFVNMEPDTMSKFRNSSDQKQDIAFSALDISNHTNNLNFLLNKYKENMSEEDINRFEYTIKFLRTAGRCVPTSDDNN